MPVRGEIHPPSEPGPTPENRRFRFTSSRPTGIRCRLAETAPGGNVTGSMRFAPSLPCVGFSWWFLLPAGLTAIPVGAANTAAPNTESSENQWVFSLLPKSFQDNPFVDQTVITEMTDEGRKLPLPSRESPAYYVAQPSGYHVEGHGTAANRPPPPALLETNLKQALANNGYLPATPDKPPSLLILYVWGVHNNPDPGSIETGGAFPDPGHKNLLSRASLVGGSKFAGELRAALEKHDLMDDVTASPLLDPVRLFTERDPKTRQLVEQSKANCYYLIASAYDYAAGAQGKRTLLWRSKMTVDAQGVSMADTLPSLILYAGKYLGRDMPEAATIVRRIKRTGQTTLGPLEVKEYLEKLPPPPTSPAPPSSPDQNKKP